MLRFLGRIITYLVRPIILPELDEMRKEIQKLEDENLALLEEIKELLANQAVLKINNTHAIERYLQENKLKNELENRVPVLVKHIGELESKLQSSLKMISKCNQQIKLLRDRIAERENEKSKLESNMKSILDQKDALLREAANKANILAEHERAISKLEYLKTDLTDALEIKSKELQSAGDEYKILKTSYTERWQHMQALKTKLHNQHLNGFVLNGVRLWRHRTVKRQLNDQLTEVRQQYQKCHNEYQQNVVQLRKTQDLYEKLQCDYNEQVTHADTLNNMAKTLEDSLKEVRTKNNNLRKEYDNLKTKYDETLNMIGKMTKQSAELKGKCETMLQDSEKNKTLIQDLTEQMTNKEKEILSLTKIIKHLNSMLEFKTKEIDLLIKEFENANLEVPVTARGIEREESNYYLDEDECILINMLEQQERLQCTTQNL